MSDGHNFDINYLKQRLAAIDYVDSESLVSEVATELKNNQASQSPEEFSKLDKEKFIKESDTIKTLIAEGDDENKDIRNIIKNMKMVDKVKLAIFGNSTCRAILIRDINRLVSEAVLTNARINESEIEAFAKNPNLPNSILRIIANNREWIKNYQVKYGLITNPKTPTDIGIRWIKYLHHKDLAKIAKTKSLPQVLVTIARKILAEKVK